MIMDNNDFTGLTSKEAHLRLGKYGKNVLKKHKKKNPYNKELSPK